MPPRHQDTKLHQVFCDYLWQKAFLRDSLCLRAFVAEKGYLPIHFAIVFSISIFTGFKLSALH